MDDLHHTWRRPSFREHLGPYDRGYREGAGPLPVHPVRPPERGTVDALIRKARYVFELGVCEVPVLHADHVYRFGYGPLIGPHLRSDAAPALTHQRIERRYVHLFGTVEFDATGQLSGSVEELPESTGDLALVLAAFCFFDASALHHSLEKVDGTDWQHGISRDIVPTVPADGERVLGYEVPGPRKGIGTVDRHHRAHIAPVGDRPPLPLSRLPRTIRPEVRCSPNRHRPGCRAQDGALRSGQRRPDRARRRLPRRSDGRRGAGPPQHLLPGATVPAEAGVDSVTVFENGRTQQPTAPHFPRENVAERAFTVAGLVGTFLRTARYGTGTGPVIDVRRTTTDGTARHAGAPVPDRTAKAIERHRSSALAVTVTFVGPVIAGGRVTAAPTSRGGGELLSLHPLLEERLKLPVVVVDDLAAAVPRYADGRDDQPFCLITVSSGIGHKVCRAAVALLLDQEGHSGELGRWTCDPSPQVSACDYGGIARHGTLAAIRCAAPLRTLLEVVE